MGLARWLSSLHQMFSGTYLYTTMRLCSAAINSWLFKRRVDRGIYFEAYPLFEYVP